MSKTIEEAAREFATHKTDNMPFGSMKAYLTCRDAECKNALEMLSWLFEKPLSERLAPTEKERIRNEYARTYPDDIDCGIENIMIRAVLERIFGKEMFEKEGE